MASFKIGNRVKIIRSRYPIDEYIKRIGDIDTIIEAKHGAYILKSDPDTLWYPDEIELVSHSSSKMADFLQK